MIKHLIITIGAFLLVLVSTPIHAQEQLHLTLAEAERLAVKNNPHLASAVLVAAASSQIPAEYRSAYFPALLASATGVDAENGTRLAAGGLTNPIVYDHIAAGVTLNQMVTDFGRTGNLVDMAKLRADAQNQTAEQTRADILLTTGQAYFGVLRAQAVLQVARQTVETRQLVADQVTALANSNLKSMLDVSFANVNLDDAKLLLVQSENALKAVQSQLATVLGLPGGTSFDLAEEPMPARLPDQPDELVQQALQNRPDLKGLCLEQSAAEKFASAEHALHYPNIGIMGSVGLVPVGASEVADHYGAIGVNINIPIFNGGLFKARETKARLQSQAAMKRVNDLELQVGHDVRIAYLNGKTAYDRLPLTEQMLSQAQSSLDLAQSRYTFGLSSIVELSQAQLNLTSAQIAAASAKYDWQAYRLNVDFQIGTLK
ncbi:MAG: TolC family protein [Thermodesulfobacteriota bacterium]